MKRISLKDVAMEAGTSPSSVSFILNGRADELRISKSLAIKVQKIANKLGYAPNQVAISLRTGQSKMIGLLVESISGHFFGLLSKTIDEESEKAGYKLFYSGTENKAQRGSDILKIYSQQQVDGYLVTPAKGMEKVIAAIVKNKKPLVLIDSYFQDDLFNRVAVDNYMGIKLGMEHLFERGYTNIGFVTVDIQLVHMEERKNAFKDACVARGLKNIKRQILVIPFSESKDKITARFGKFFSEHGRLDAIFFATNYLAIAALSYFQANGVRVPQDISIICFDDHELFRLLPNGITAIEQPINEIGKKAIEILLQQLEKGIINTPLQIIKGKNKLTKLKLRNSSG